ncbi:MAG TPA: hypothetical protein VEK57_06275 [Thermoanaerobaculia bacterium]|nr:hypothetical protein [Thermoanaerobaculia bacterium]
MRKTIVALSLGFALFVAPSMFAQATRTWVSGVGDDANPCSRTAPCKTFAGAISKTAAGGEISVLDPGGYGALNITKSITLNGAGTLASILFSGTNGIIVNGAGITVNITDISLNGGTPTSPGVNGIRIIQAANVSVNNCDIFNFSTSGIRDERTVAGFLTVKNTRIHNSILFGGNTTTIGLHITPSAGVVALTAVCDGCIIFGHPEANSNGVFASNGGKVAITRSTINNNTRGITVGNAGEVTVVDSTLHANQQGIRTVAGATVRLAGTSISASTVNGLAIIGGVIESFGNNYIAGNTGNNGAGMTLIGPQ